MAQTKNKKRLIMFPDAMVADIDLVANSESRSVSETVREAVRLYVDTFKKKHNIRLNPECGFELPGASSPLSSGR